MPFTETPPAFTWANLNDTWADLDSIWARGTFIQIGDFTGFTLDSQTQGIIGQDILDGDIDFVSITEFVFDASTNRGRNRDLERTSAGIANVQLRNENRTFDPLNADTPFQNLTIPRKPFRILINAEPLFAGFTNDWNYTYNVDGQSVATVEAIDGFLFLARQTNSELAVPEENTGDRIEKVLDQPAVRWPTDLRDINTGNATLADGVLGDNVLTYLNQVEESEQGLIFVTKDGKFAFRERFLPPESTALTFSDDGSGVPFEEIDIVYGAEYLVNRATVISVAGTAIVQNDFSAGVYGVADRALDTLLSSVPQLEAAGQYVVARYGNPEYRVERITVNVRGLSDSNKAQVFALELNDQVDAVFTPNNIGLPVAVRTKIIGIAHDIGVDTHRVSFSLEALPFEFFIIGDPVLGKLDSDDIVLGF